jgi:MFS family permease
MNQHSAAPVLGFSSIGHFFAHLLMLLYPTVVLALEGQWGMSYGDLLSLSLVGFVLFGLGALPAGWLGDRWSDEWMMVVFFVGTGSAAIATGLTDGPVQLALGLAAIGLFGSIYHPVGTAWLVRNSKNRGRALGVNGIAGSIGLGTASLVAGALAQMIGWRAAFIIPGALCAATGLALLCCIRGGRGVRHGSSIIRSRRWHARTLYARLSYCRSRCWRTARSRRQSRSRCRKRSRRG